MSNGNMPANPILGDTEAFILFLDGIKGGNNYGLTKREDIAKHMMLGMVRGIGCCFSDQDGYAEHARQALFATDALLRALDKGSNTNG